MVRGVFSEIFASLGYTHCFLCSGLAALGVGVGRPKMADFGAALGYEKREGGDGVDRKWWGV